MRHSKYPPSVASRAFNILKAGMLMGTMLFSIPLYGQQAPDAPTNGMRQAELRTHAIVHATVVTEPGTILEDATIIIRQGVIEAVGTDLVPPADARVWDAEGLTIYPGLIDAAVLVDASLETNSSGRHWNGRVHPELNINDQPTLSQSLRDGMREIGFTTAAVYPKDGLFRGTGAVLSLAEDGEHVLSYDDRSLMAMGFDYGGGWQTAAYPGSQMGSIALLRQTLYDAQWHARTERVYSLVPNGKEPPRQADALSALADVVKADQAVLFECSDEHNILRAARLANEFKLDMHVLGSGMEFRRLEEVVVLDMPLVVPIEFPKRPEINTLHQAERVTLRDMQTWEQAPTNIRRLLDAGADVAITTHKLKSRGGFHKALRNAIKHGLSEDQALAALTTTPAAMLGIDQACGTIAPGKAANLIVVKGSLFEKDMKIRDVWVHGRRSEISSDDDITFVAKARLTTSTGASYVVDVDTTKSSFSLTMPADEDVEDAKDKNIKAKKVVVQRDQVSVVLEGAPFDSTGYVHLTGAINDDVIIGTGARAGSDLRFTFDMTPLTEEEIAALEEVEAEEDDEVDDEDGEGNGDEPAAEAPASAVDGVWNLKLDIPDAPMEITMTLTLHLEDDGSVSGVANIMGNDQPMAGGTFDPASGALAFRDGQSGASIEGIIEGDDITGTASQGPGMTAQFSGSREGGSAGRGTDEEEDDATFEMPPAAFVTPLGAYGLSEQQAREDVLITNATIWTSGPDGIIEGGDLFVRNGRVEYVGPGRVWDIGTENGIRLIDGTGMHVTPGLIDCHSHTGITGGINEWTQVNTAEVRIGDIVNPDDIDWYRQLAGGLTAANMLHGSANPIGGQNAVVKIKWGGTAEDFLINNAVGGIKFALGENVIRTQTRYPNTRMGVETVLVDAFTAAREYEAEMKRYQALGNAGMSRAYPPRRDLEMDTLVEILNGERLVHCHSYRQDEILMLIRVAEQFGFTIGTFQHVLEGYKVADEIARHGAGGSSFSDWWAYKVEVMDAIPHNGALMTDVGVLVSFNSDSDELARRMNTEAAKAVRYGGLAPSEALKLVTINPAKQLRIDDRTGSLEAGKDGDFALWNHNPLSTYARCQQTWIEGVCYYDIEDHALRSLAVQQERDRLIQKILADAHGAVATEDEEAATEGSADENTTEPQRPLPRAYQWMVADAVAWMEEKVRLGQDPEAVMPGECGCNDFILHLMQSSIQK